MENIAFEVHDLTVSYQYKPVLWGVDCHIPSGKLVAIVGPNGAGKSTLIKAALGLIPKASGEVLVFGEPLEKKRSIIAYVPQRSEVDWDFPISAYDVVMMGRTSRKSFFSRVKEDDHIRVRVALEKVGMTEYANRQISQLSGGQQQRIFIARALAQDASIYLLDEPFSGVDAATEKAIAELFIELKNEGKTIICVHHDLHTVLDYFDWALLLNLRLLAAGAAKEVLTVENLQKTYGGRLGLLSDVAEKLRKSEWKERAE